MSASDKPVEPVTEVTLDELEASRPFKLTPGAALPAVPESGDVPLPNGCRLYWETDQSIGCRVYSSDEIGGGVHVWNSALVDPHTLLTAIITEEHLGRLEREQIRRRLGDTMRQRTHWFSIFGQVEAAAAEVMIKSGEIQMIPAAQIPASVATNDRGEPARFAVIVPANKLDRFEKLIADLMA